MSGRNVNGQYKIIYDDADHEERQRFTVAHEIGHILLGHKEDSEYAEKCANYFASYFLVPTPMVEKVKCEDFLDVSDKFSVSLSCAVHAFDRYNRWLFFGGYKYKEYEIKMLENFKKIKNNI